MDKMANKNSHLSLCLVAPKKNFSNDKGFGVTRYCFEMANRLKPDMIYSPKRLSLINRIFGYPSGLDNYKIIHILDTLPFKKPKRATLVVTVHDFHPFEVPELNPTDYKTIKGILGLYLVLLPGFDTAMQADYLISNSSQTKSEAIKYGFPKDKIFIANLGIDERFINKPIPAKKHEAFKLGYIGALSTTRNLAYAIEAFKKISDRDIVFEIWGLKQEAYPKLLNQAKDDRRIRFTGFAPEDKLIEIYDSFDAFIMPTLYEGFCLPIYEAQARGLPVIILSEAKIPDEAKKYCLKVNDVEEMAATIVALKNREIIVKKEMIGYAHQFTWQRTVEQTIKAYNEIFKREGL